MTKQHRRIENLHFQLLAPGCFEHHRAALSTFTELAELLQRHMRTEDQVILSAVAETAAKPQDRQLARDLMVEHREIETRVEALWVQLRGEDAVEKILSNLESLDWMLSRHIQREEWITYDAYDALARPLSAFQAS